MKPFLTLPFKSEFYYGVTRFSNRVRGSYKIGGGWFYKPTDLVTKFVEHNRHFGIDFSLPRRTPVLASASGWALASYHHYLLRQKKDRRRFLRWKGRLVGVGQGNFVIIYHPKPNCFTQYGHLEKINPAIPFYKPEKKRGLIQPSVKKFQPRFFNKKNACRVKRGEVIGWVGDSGIIGGWDEPHLHFEVYRYRDKEGRKPEDSYLDPYDIRKTAEHYPWPKHKRPLGDRHLWILGRNGLPKYP